MAFETTPQPTNYFPGTYDMTPLGGNDHDVVHHSVNLDHYRHDRGANLPVVSLNVDATTRIESHADDAPLQRAA